MKQRILKRIFCFFFVFFFSVVVVINFNILTLCSCWERRVVLEYSISRSFQRRSQSVLNMLMLCLRLSWWYNKCWSPFICLSSVAASINGVVIIIFDVKRKKVD